MRLKINFSKNTSKVPINNQHLVNGYLHKVLGKDNIIHDSLVKNYSISMLQGGKMINKDYLDYINGSYIILSSNDKDFLNNIIPKLMLEEENHTLFCGMKFTNIEYLSQNFQKNYDLFCTLTPILLKKDDKFVCLSDKISNRVISLNHTDYSKYLTNYLIRKLAYYDLDLTGLKIEVIEKKSKVKQILVNNVINYATECYIRIYSSKDVRDFIYHSGIGYSCGSGFGNLFMYEDFDKYR